MSEKLEDAVLETIIQRPFSTVISISRFLETDKTHVYKTLRSLTNKGLIEKNNARPAEFVAIEPEENMNEYGEKKIQEFIKLMNENLDFRRKWLEKMELSGDTLEAAIVEWGEATNEELVEWCKDHMQGWEDKKKFEEEVLKLAACFKTTGYMTKAKRKKALEMYETMTNE